MFRFSNLTKLLAVGFCVGGLQLNAANQLQDGNSVVDLALDQQMGMNTWFVDGQNQLYQQWFWYAVGGAAEQSIDSIGVPVVVLNGANQLTSTYSGVGFDLSITYTLQGGAFASGQSTVNEDIVINSRSSSPLSFRFYQYSDYNLGGVDQDTVQISAAFDNALVTYGLNFIGEVVETPAASRGEVKPYDVTLLKLNDGLATDLDGTLGPDGPGDITFAFQWDFTLNPEGSFIISKVKTLQVQVIPEPTSAFLVMMGMALFGLIRCRKN